MKMLKFAALALVVGASSMSAQAVQQGKAKADTGKKAAPAPPHAMAKEAKANLAPPKADAKAAKVEAKGDMKADKKMAKAAPKADAKAAKKDTTKKKP